MLQGNILKNLEAPLIKLLECDSIIMIKENNRNLRKKAANYWCLQFNINRNETHTYKFKKIWTPFR